MPSPESAVSACLCSSTARTMSSVEASAPAIRIPVWLSGLIVMPGRGVITAPNRSSPASCAVTAPITRRTAGLSTVSVSECTTTCTAAEELPPKCCCASSRTRTDSDPFACQPAPAREVNTLGAAAPSAINTTNHAPNTQRVCPAMAAPAARPCAFRPPPIRS